MYNNDAQVWTFSYQTNGNGIVFFLVFTLPLFQLEYATSWLWDVVVECLEGFPQGCHE
jgi:hypothetical protein